MAGKLEKEIRQTKPFKTVEEEAALNIARTYEVMATHQGEFLKPFGLSPTQYNVLRILRGAGQDGATCSQVAERMIAHDPDITRLLDRMEARQWVVRSRSKEDRRIVITQISRTGLELVNSIDVPLAKSLKETIGKVGKRELAALVDSLEKIREAFE